MNDTAGNERLGQVQSLVRAFGILDELCKAEGISLRELAAKVDLPRSTVHRLLTTLESLEYASFDRSEGLWYVGRSAFKVGAAFAKTSDLGRLGRNIMNSLVIEVQHSANLSIVENSDMLFVKQIEAKGSWLTAARPGVRLPMYSTASGKAILACYSEAELDLYLADRSLHRRTEQTITDPEALRDELQKIRECGFAVDDEEETQGQRCVAAAVIDPAGRSKGALSISDSSVRLRRGRLREIGPSLVSAARRIGTRVAHSF